ncbi:MAG: hypothetical protein ABIH65_00385 [Nanoarchaeota archaeon]
MKDIHKYGIGFWIGALVYSLINMIFNLNHVLQSNILMYNYEIAGIAVLGLILNIVLMKRAKR